ncbi:nucleoside triphosphate pyrophosphohydrolase [Parashewanella spongiae]|uniref:Nucleoside triphosphate pyrophosphohydrolase n=2 Tax=Parashewanella spongiae TaxID=342950 RepID=A0A3A6UKE9_9GAMM|nr:nucleoside triphosphate pyrophosphohydrolase [Parashewanella spongiae]RJY18039.1 nucleoside triphosphate pyrophosphohydrolase [Parashewanella spongiae]
MQKLRDPELGCPWDKKQNYDSIVPFTIEEAYEVADVIERNAWDELPDELGDLLFQVIFYCQLAAEEGRFEFNTVVERLSNKLLRRHPHVFGNQNQIYDTKQQNDSIDWEALKSQERQQRDQLSVLDDIPTGLPALSRSKKIQKRVVAVGFDWNDIKDVAAKVTEELEEVMQEVHQEKQRADRIQDEMGDLLFSVVNLARHLGIDPEQALRQANSKFERRFRGVEKAVKDDNHQIEKLGLDILDDYWKQVKAIEK